MKIVTDQFPDIRNYETCMIGDMIDRDIDCAHKHGIRSVWYRFSPYRQNLNLQKLQEGILPDFTIVNLLQLPHLLASSLSEDAAFIS